MKLTNSEQRLLFDITCIVRFICPRVRKYAQKSPSTVNYHTYPSGKKVIKAFTANNFSFYDKAGNIIDQINHASSDTATKVKITRQIQKNRQNGQTITLLAAPTFPRLCLLGATIRMVIRARCLKQTGSLPVACYLHKKKLVYLTGT